MESAWTSEMKTSWRVHEIDIYDLSNKALANCGLENLPYAIDQLMGDGFWMKNWAWRRFGDAEQQARNVTPEEIEKLKLLAGPHGYTVWKMMQARSNERQQRSVLHPKRERSKKGNTKRVG